MKYLKNIIICIALIGIVFLTAKYEIKNVHCLYITTLWHNLKLVSTALCSVLPLVLLSILLILICTNKWSLHVEKLNIGGFSILFDNPTKLFKRQVKNYLDSKRTVFVIDFEHDNFKETFDSYYEIYHFFRDEIKILGDIQNKRFGDNESFRLYTLANETLKVLNKFLTENQSDYRRWYMYIQKFDEKEYYLMPIGTLQKKYGDYTKLCSDFKKINQFFTNKIASEFEINMGKWSE